MFVQMFIPSVIIEKNNYYLIQTRGNEENMKYYIN